MAESPERLPAAVDDAAASLALRIARNESTASGSANCSPRKPLTKRRRLACAVSGASAEAEKPRFDRLFKDSSWTTLDASGVAVGLPGEELVAFGDEVELLVVGSRGYGPVRRMMLGSTSMHLARAARCPLLVLPRPMALDHAQDDS